MNGLRYNVYDQHKGAFLSLPECTSLREVRELAEAMASNGSDALLRVFERDSDGESFVLAYSVLDGEVRAHRDVTIPADHW